MNKLSQQETLAELQVRHAELVARPYLNTECPQLYRDWLLNQLMSVQLDVLRFHAQNEQAKKLLRQLDTLQATALTLPLYELKLRLLTLLRAPYPNL